MPFDLPSPELIWGLLPRIVGALFVLAHGSLISQVTSVLGSRGVAPITPRLARIRRDYPGVRRFFDYPTLLWIDSSDTTLKLIPCVGALAGTVAMYGGDAGFVGLVIAWLLFLSLEPVGLVFPWDTLLLEAGFLALFLPQANALPDVTAAALPLPSVAFMWRFLIARLMWGFAKVKFIGTEPGDGLYLRGFFVWMPMPNPLGFLAHHAPRWFLYASLGFMFVAEVIMPGLALFAGPARLVGFFGLVGLMVGIQLTGNWGYFNIGYALLCVCLLDTRSSLLELFDAPLAAHVATPETAFVNLAMLALFLSSLVYFALNSWVTRTWSQWPFDDVTWNRPWARVLIRVFRALSPFRLTNGYGVFPPHSPAPMRIIPVFEGSNDGETWKPYVYRFMPTLKTSPPPVIAPHHPRLDQALYYAANGMHDGSLYASLVGDGNPYNGYCRSSWLDRLGQRLLEGEPELTCMFAHNPFAERPPKLVRVSAIAMTPNPISHLKATGEWWHQRRLGTLIPARALDASLWDEGVSCPELFHPDWVDFKRRAPALERVLEAFAAGTSPNRAVLEAGEISETDVTRFWMELVPLLADEARGDFTQLAEKAEVLAARFTRAELYTMERVLERLCWILRKRLERNFFADATPKIAARTNFRFHLLLHTLVLDGEASYLRALDDPQLACARLESATDGTLLWALAALRYDAMMALVCAFRWSDIGLRGHEKSVPGPFEHYPFLKDQVPPGEEFCPRPVKLKNGEFEIPGFYPPPVKGAPDDPATLAPSADSRA